MTSPGVPRKTGLVVSRRDHRREHDGVPLPPPTLAVCARCLRHMIAGNGPHCRSCAALESERRAAEIETSGQLCACGCGVRFAPDPRKIYASRECKVLTDSAKKARATAAKRVARARRRATGASP